MTTDATLAKGFRRRGNFLQLSVRVKGQFHSRSYPLTLTVAQQEKARAAFVAELTFATPAPLVVGRTLAEDAVRYLAIVARMPTFTDRQYRIEQWVARLGHRVRATITSTEIRAVLEGWRRDGRHDGAALTVASLNTRRTALQHLYTVLDGKSAINIVKDVPRYKEPGAKAQDIPMVTISRVVRTFPLRSKTRARLRVLQWLGWPAGMIQQLTPKDVDLVRGRVLAPDRDKAQGFPGGWVPVKARTLAVLRYFFRVGADGYFSTSSMHSRLEEHCVKAGVAPFNPYALKHSFGTWAATRVKDNDALRDLLRTHSIDRYIEGARATRMEAARQALEARPGRPVARATFALDNMRQPETSQLPGQLRPRLVTTPKKAVND